MGYEVAIYAKGTVADVEKEGKEGNIVGIITASHGGCPLNAPPRALDVNEKPLLPSSLREMMRASDSEQFQTALLCHCYSYWAPQDDKPSELRRGPVDRCRRDYAAGLGVGMAKVHMPRLADDGSTQGHWTILSVASFFRRFKPGCCIR